MESTKKIYLHGLAASLVGLAVMSASSLLVIRLSLVYLGKEEFGLISLLSQISAYISVLDLGLYVAFSRILINYNNGSKQRYADALRTASRVFHLLGAVAFAIAVLVALAGASWLSIPPRLHHDYLLLMMAQGVALAVSFSLKPISAPLVASGRHYMVYWVNSVVAVLNVLIYWVGLKVGLGIYSSAASLFGQLALYAFLVLRLARPHLDTGGLKGRFERSIFREVLSFGRDSVLWQVGGQTLASLPVLLASAWFALSAAADLSAGMKLILLLVAVCTRFVDMSVTPLSIEHVKGREENAAAQMVRIAGISGGIGVCAALAVVCVNPAFLSWWMLDKVDWPWHANVSGALWIALLTVNQCMYGYAVITLQMKLLRWALLAECAIYLALALLARSIVGAPSLLWAKPLATLLVGLFLFHQMNRHTRINAMRLVPGFVRQALALTVLIPLCLWASRWLQLQMTSPFFAFIAACGLAALAGCLALPVVFTKEMRTDLGQVMRSGVGRICSKLSPANR